MPSAWCDVAVIPGVSGVEDLPDRTRPVLSMISYSRTARARNGSGNLDVAERVCLSQPGGAVHGASASDRALRSQKSLRRRTMTPLRNASVAAIGRSTNRAEILRRTFAIDVLECPTCKGRMKLVAMVTEPRNIARFLSALRDSAPGVARGQHRRRRRSARCPAPDASPCRRAVSVDSRAVAAARARYAALHRNPARHPSRAGVAALLHGWPIRDE